MPGLLFLLVVALPACTSKPENSTEPTPVLSGPPETTYPMPPINGKSFAEMGWELDDGQHVKVSSFENKVLVLDFYATWCAPCRESVPHLNHLQQRFGAQGLQIIGLNVGGPDDRAEVPAFAREFNIRYPLGFPDAELSELLLSASNAIPQTFIFDRQGQLIKRYVGYDDSLADELDREIQTALASQSN